MKHSLHHPDLNARCGGQTGVKVILEERTADFIRSLEPPADAEIEMIRIQAQKDGVPIIRQETAALLSFMVTLVKPMRILEVGCAVGYSAIIMSRAMPQGASVTTIEKFAPRIPEARRNFWLTGTDSLITLIEGDAAEVLKELSGTYDLIFMDAAKGQYLTFLPEVLRLLCDGGLLISDNVLQDGDVLESRFAVTRRNRTIHSRMREYLYTLKHTKNLVTSLLPLGDGVTLTTKKGTVFL